LLLESFIRLLEFFVVVGAFAAKDNFAFFDFVAVVDKHEVLQVFEVEGSHIFYLFLVFGFETVEEGVHGLTELGVTHDFEVLVVVVFL
jgi:hypothetical protein